MPNFILYYNLYNMKKTLLTILSLGTIATAFAQPSPQWPTEQNTNFPIPVAGVKFIDAVDNNTVWLTGYDGSAPNRNYCFYSKSTDGGATFTSGPIFTGTNIVTGDTSTYVIANLEGIDGNTAWLSTYRKGGSPDRGNVFKTTNGGGTWTNMNSAAMFSVVGQSFLNVIAMMTPSVGVAMGDPIGGEHEIWRTLDAGATWAQVPGANIPNPLSGEYGLVNIYAKNGSQNLWFGTNTNRIYRSTDAGLTWSVSPQFTSGIGSPLGINDIAFVDANYGFCTAFFGPTGNGTVTLWNTQNGGATWNQIPNVDANFGRNDMCNIPGTALYASCDNQNGILSRSNNFGVNWSNWGSTGIGYVAIDFATSTTGWAGTFSSTLATVGGIYKYTGPDLFVALPAVANFSLNSSGCNGVAMTMTNNSLGSPIPTFTWSSNPAANISNTNAVSPTITFTNNGTYTVTLVASNAGTTTSTTRTLTVATCVGLDELNISLQNFGTFPNPANEQMNISVAGANEFTYQFVNLLGKDVLDGVSTGENTVVNVSGMAKGIYFLIVQTNGLKATKKVIID